ncbi:TPA: ATP-dependent helicase [Stenotrophomonas maltophilia]|nr:ATP-dependent helicase [Stenotrophomonas maltophilia]HDS1043676.1 ATP-dependent helicase [Stenotrophomonas maltophilia]
MSATDDLQDAEADELIISCLDLTKPRSFFLYAGAGSGKTRSLVEAIRTVCERQGRDLSLSGQRIGVITYTNAACDEIKQRLEFDPRVEVSTIHAFAWSLISGYDNDIREWVANRLLQDIAELEEAQAKGRATSKAAIDRARSIESKRRRYDNLNSILRFIYSPTGDNRTRDSLNHSEVIAMTADFLSRKPGLRRLLVTAFPVLLIDESQDTNRQLMDALLAVEAHHRASFCLGLFGDTMQRIYADGKERLAEAIPEHWARPRKIMNHRCPARVVELINRVRQEVDDEKQTVRRDAAEGTVRLFIANQEADKPATEAAAAGRMREITGDDGWSSSDAIKMLALEHLMSARRFGFERFFSPLYPVERIRTSLLQGTGAGIGFFTREVLPLLAALRASDRFAVASIVRKTSPLLERQVLQDANKDQAAVLAGAKTACDGLLDLASSDPAPTARQVLRYIAEKRLFTIPDVLAPFVAPDVPVEGADAAAEGEDQDEEDLSLKTELGGWRLALEATLDEIERYNSYIQGTSSFDTHQGVKGLEFPRVMVIVSDDEARGFMFAYEKLFGEKDQSETDLKNAAAGKETSIDRTRRLFYVTCSRAEKSLAVVYYAESVEIAQAAALRQGWFARGEIEIVT